MAANLPLTGRNDKSAPYSHSARGHYWRQVNKYHPKEKTKKSIVVVIYNVEGEWWAPTEKNLKDNKDVLYLTALHTNANVVNLYWGNDKTPKTIRLGQNSDTPLFTLKPKKSKKNKSKK